MLKRMPPPRIVVSLAVVVIALLPACSDDGDDGGETASTEMRLTITDEGCTYEGDETPTGPTFTLNTENQGSRFVNYGLSRIPERYVDVERERLDEGEASFFRMPSYFGFVAGGGIGAGLSGSALIENVTAGVYALWCANEQPPTTIYVTALLDATE